MSRNPGWSLFPDETDLSFLADVEVSGIADGQVIVWDEAQQQWRPAVGTEQLLLNDLADVDVPDPADGDTLKYDEDLGGWVTGRGAVDGGVRHEVLKKFSEADGGAFWEVVAPFGPEPPGRVHGIGDLWIETDVDYD